MTDRIHSLVVVLAEDMREDDCETLINAIRMMRNVASVSRKVSDINSHMAEVRARNDLGEKIWSVLYPKAKS